MADQQHRAPVAGDLAHLAEALGLKVRIADRQHLVDEEDLAVQVGGDREGQTDVHAGREPLDLSIEEPLHAGEGDDRVEALTDLLAAHPEQRAVQVHVLAAGQLGMEAGPDLEQAADAPAELDAALGRRSDPVDDLEQGALPCAVAADDADDLSPLDLEAHVVERVELLDLFRLAGLAETPENRLGRIGRLLLALEDAVGLREVRDRDGEFCLGHS